MVLFVGKVDFFFFFRRLLLGTVDVSEWLSMVQRYVCSGIFALAREER